MGGVFLLRATELCWEEASGSNQSGCRVQRQWRLGEGGDLQAAVVPSVRNSALLMTQILEVLQAGKLINYFPGVSLTEDRNDAWWAWKGGQTFQLIGNLFPGLTAATWEGIENICASDKRSHLKTRKKPAQQHPVSHQTPSSPCSNALCY